MAETGRAAQVVFAPQRNNAGVGQRRKGFWLLSRLRQAGGVPRRSSLHPHAHTEPGECSGGHQSCAGATYRRPRCRDLLPLRVTLENILISLATHVVTQGPCSARWEAKASFCPLRHWGLLLQHRRPAARISGASPPAKCGAGTSFCQSQCRSLIRLDKMPDSLFLRDATPEPHSVDHYAGKTPSPECNAWRLLLMGATLVPLLPPPVMLDPPSAARNGGTFSSHLLKFPSLSSYRV